VVRVRKRWRKRTDIGSFVQSLMIRRISVSRTATKEIGLEVNAHKTKYMTVSRDQNAGRIHSMNDNSSIERVEEFKY